MTTHTKYCRSCGFKDQYSTEMTFRLKELWDPLQEHITSIEIEPTAILISMVDLMMVMDLQNNDHFNLITVIWSWPDWGQSPIMHIWICTCRYAGFRRYMHIQKVGQRSPQRAHRQKTPTILSSGFLLTPGSHAILLVQPSPGGRFHISFPPEAPRSNVLNIIIQPESTIIIIKHHHSPSLSILIPILIPNHHPPVRTQASLDSFATPIGDQQWSPPLLQGSQQLHQVTVSHHLNQPMNHLD